MSRSARLAVPCVGTVFFNRFVKRLVVAVVRVETRLACGSGACSALQAAAVAQTTHQANPITHQAGNLRQWVCCGTCATLQHTNGEVAWRVPLLPLRVQFFWEAFPAGSGPTDRTTYMFAYMDAAPTRPAMADVFEEYCECTAMVVN